MSTIKEPMDLSTPAGRKVILHTLDAGYDVDRINVKQYLKLGEAYTVEEIIVGNWESTLYLKEFPRVPFNTAFFSNEVLNFEIQVKKDKNWFTVASEDSISDAVDVASKMKVNNLGPIRVFSKRSKKVLYED
jgi:hypothetical protein